MLPSTTSSPCAHFETEILDFFDITFDNNLRVSRGCTCIADHIEILAESEGYIAFVNMKFSDLCCSLSCKSHRVIHCLPQDTVHEGFSW